jgi:flap endonuclease-1
MLRNITSQSGPLVLIFGSEIPRELAISTSSFVDFAILIGTDFSPRIQGLGPHRALKLIKSYGNLEDALEAAKPRYSPEPRHSSADYLERVRTARRIFTTLPSAPSREELAAKSNYDGKLVAEILDQYDLTHLAERMDQGKFKTSHAFEQDYYQSALGSGGLD